MAVKRVLSLIGNKEEMAGETSACDAEWTGDEDTHFLGGSRNRQRPSKRFKSGSDEPMNRIPDEILIAIFSSIPSAWDRSNCACVCKRWLTIQSQMHREDFHDCPKPVPDESEVNQPGRAPSSGEEVLRLEKQPHWAIGDLSRCLEGRKATDVRLASIAVGTFARGGLGKLTVRGGPGERSAKGVTDVGLRTIGICCNALKSLTLWDCPNVTDSSLETIGKGCRLLENLDLLKCPNFTDRGMQSIAKGCLRLSYLSIDSCEGIGDASIEAISANCSNLMVLSISRCPKVGDKVVASVGALRKLKLEKIGITNKGLATLGNRSKSLSLTKMVLSGLDKVSEAGFLSFTFSEGLRFLKLLVLSNCRGITDRFLSRLGDSCKCLSKLWLIDCERVTDKGLEGFVKGCQALSGLHIEKCAGVTYRGFSASLRYTTNLKTLHVSRCSLVQDRHEDEEDSSVDDIKATTSLVQCGTLRSLSITYCEGVEDNCLEYAGRLFPYLEHLDLSGLGRITDDGMCGLLELAGGNLLTVNLSECTKLTDKTVFEMSNCCLGLQAVVLSGCRGITDKSIGMLASKCTDIQDLDISKCTVTDDGVLAVVIAVGQTLKTLTLADCDGITDEALNVIRRMCDSLTALNLKNCSRLSAEAVERFEMEVGKRCDVLIP